MKGLGVAKDDEDCCMVLSTRHGTARTLVAAHQTRLAHWLWSALEGDGW